MLVQRGCSTGGADAPNNSLNACIASVIRKRFLTIQTHYLDRSRWSGKSQRQTVCEIARGRIQKQVDHWSMQNGTVVPSAACCCLLVSISCSVLFHIHAVATSSRFTHLFKPFGWCFCIIGNGQYFRQRSILRTCCKHLVCEHVAGWC